MWSCLILMQSSKKILLCYFVWYKIIEIFCLLYNILDIFAFCYMKIPKIHYLLFILDWTFYENTYKLHKEFERRYKVFKENSLCWKLLEKWNKTASKTNMKVNNVIFFSIGRHFKKNSCRFSLSTFFVDFLLQWSCWSISEKSFNMGLPEAYFFSGSVRFF